MNEFIQDGNFKKLGTKLLMSRLRQEAIRAKLAESNHVEQMRDPPVVNVDGRYASSFVPPNQPSSSSSSSSSNDKSRSQAEHHLYDDSSEYPRVASLASASAIGQTSAGREAEDVEWEDGYVDMGQGKAITGMGNADDDSVESHDEVDWVRLIQTFIWLVACPDTHVFDIPRSSGSSDQCR